MLFRHFILALLSSLLLSGCNDHGDLTGTLDAGTFTVNTPEGWQLIREAGYDSNVGRIVGPLGTIHFDQGVFSPGLDNISANEHTISFKRITIHDRPAILHKERTVGNDVYGKVRLTAYIDEGEGMRRNRLYVYDPSPWAETLIIEIMKTHRFK